MSVAIFRCGVCGHTCFPARQICRRCGGAEWTQVVVERGVVEAATTLRHQADTDRADTCHLASVRIECGVTVLARLDRLAEPGETVALFLADTGAVVGR